MSGNSNDCCCSSFGCKNYRKTHYLDEQCGTDQAASIEPHGLGILVNHIRAVENSLGTGIKKVYDSEFSPRSKLRKYKSLN